MNRKMTSKQRKQLARIGGICRLFRISNDLTINDIADNCDYGFNTISLFERGKKDSAYIFNVYYEMGMDYIIWSDKYDSAKKERTKTKAN